MTGATFEERGVSTANDGDYRIGIDLGGTKIAAGLVDIETGAVTHFRRRPTPVAAGPAAIIRDVADISAEIIALANSEEIGRAHV